MANFGSLPIGFIGYWAKSMTNTPQNLPYGWAECNGQAISDPNSPYNGQSAPSINSTTRFIRGSTTSGGTGGSDTHTHTHNISVSTASFNVSAGMQTLVTAVSDAGVGSASNLPSYYQAVAIIKIK